MLCILLIAVISVLLLSLHIKKSDAEPETPDIEIEDDTLEKANLEKPHRKVFSFLVCTSVFWSIGLIMFLGGCIKFFHYRDAMNTYQTTTAIVTDIHEYKKYNDDDYTQTDLILKYTINNREYQSTLKNTDLIEDVGNVVGIYYSPDNPEKIFSHEDVKSRLSFIILVGAFLCVMPVAAVAYNLISPKCKSP